jgi:hypothetical protein
VPIPKIRKRSAVERARHEKALKESAERRKRINEMLKKKPWDIGDVEGRRGDMTATKTRLKPKK